MTPQPDLTDFLAARLDEDEATAQAAAERPGPQWANVDEDGDGDPNGVNAGFVTSDSSVIVYEEGYPTVAEAAHIARHDPERICREVAAKRAILAAYQAVNAEIVTMLGDRRPRKYGEWDGLHLALCQLAAVWSDHPDYDEAWTA